MRKVISLILSLAMVLTFVIIAVPAKKADAETPLILTMPENDGNTDKTSYIIGQGTEDEVKVTCNFIPASYQQRPNPNQHQTQEYITVHCTDNWSASAGAKAHNSWLTGNNTGVSFAYVVGSDGIWQNLPDLEKSWHAADNEFGTNVWNSNSIGIETCDNGAPTRSNGWPAWNTQELYTWYEEVFAQRVGYLSMLVAMLCVRYDFNPYTQIVQHYDVFGKECPIELRYVFGTSTDTGSRQDGTYWKIFWDKMLKYYKAFGGTKDGYVKGNYRTSTSMPLYNSADRSSGQIASIPIKTTLNVTDVSGDFGKVSYNGKTGWIYMQGAICLDVVGANKVKYVKPVDNFAFTDSSVVQKDGIIYGVKENITGNALNAMSSNNLKVLSKSGEQITSGLVGTGCKVQSLNASGGVVAEATVFIKGDIDGDGKVTQNDYIIIKSEFKKPKNDFDTYQAMAAEVTGRKKLTVSDYLAVKRHVQKLYDLYK